MKNVIFALLAVTLSTTGCGVPEAPPGDGAATPVDSGAASTTAEAPSGPPRTATIYRDTYGVPHVYAEAEADAAYTLGYVQAQDRLPDLYRNIRYATGRMAEAFGRDHLDTDYLIRLVKNAERSQAAYEAAPPHLRALADSYVRGVQAQIAERGGELPEGALDIEPWHPLAIGHAMILRWPIGNVLGEVDNEPRPVSGSNAWAVAPERTADNNAILLADPHMAWEGLALFHEARVHAPDFDLCGFFIVGSPLLAFGHNGHVGFAFTTGGPDTSDVYELRLNKDVPGIYEMDGKWKPANVSFIEIPVKDGEPVRRMVAYTEWGPVITEPDSETAVAYAGATPYLEANDLFEQMYRMNKATSTQEFYDALAMNQLMEQNVIYAGRDGTIGYVRAGRVPIRPEGYDWRAPVPGWTSETKWQGIHPIEDLVQIQNPESGYLQNCNISPANMMVDSPLLPDAYPDYIYNVSWDDQNPRSERLVPLLDTLNPMTRDQAKAIAMDVYDILADRWLAALTTALEAQGQHYPDEAFSNTAETLRAWDGRYTPESTGATLMRFWRTRVDGALAQQIAAGETLDAAGQRTLLDALDNAIKTLESHYGSAEVPYGDIFKVGRNGQYFPTGGADYGSGAAFTETLFDVRSREEPAGSGQFVAYDGSFSVMLMFFGPERIESFSCYHWGISSDPESPHFLDQARELYSKRELKPTWFEKDALMEHVQSTATLAVP